MTRENLTRAKGYLEDTSQNVANRASSAVGEVIEHLESIKDKPDAPSKGLPDYMGMVTEFHRMTGQPIGIGKPGICNWKICVSRLRLISEESGELVKAMDTYSELGVAPVADALADLLYVVFGTAITFGIPMDRVFREVHESNMTKKGGHIEGGKWIKPEGYKAVDLSWLEYWRQ